MKDKIEAVVLSETPYGENSQLLQTITKHHGYLSFIAKSSRKIGSKNRIFPFTHYQFICDFKEGKTIFSLQGSDVIRSYFRQDLKSMAYLNLLGEMVSRTHVDYPDDLFEDLLCVLEQAESSSLYKYASFLVARLLRYQGLQPYTDGCVVCGSALINGFSSEKGGFVCEQHSHLHDQFPIETLRKLRHIFLVDRKKIPLLAEDFTEHDFDLLVNFLHNHGDIKLRSYDFFRRC